MNNLGFRNLTTDSPIHSLCLSVLLVMLSTTFGTIAGAETDSQADPGIVVYPASDDELQTVREGNVFTAAIPIRNPYDRAVRIIRKESTCVCNTLETEKDFLLPGESTTLHFAVPNERISGRGSQIVWLYLSDPDFEPIEVRIRWLVEATVAVDLLPPNQREIKRPDDVLWRDIYRLESVERPEDGSKLQKNMLLSTSVTETPEGGFAILGIDYAGSLWTFTTRKVNDQQSLVMLRAADPNAVMPQGTFEETFTIRTNHPDKAAIVIELGTMIDPEAGKPVDNPLLQPPIPMP